MKKFFILMSALLMLAASSKAMSYEQARQQAMFLADKMAYELNLSEEQYEACYEVNLDYFMGINSERDLYGDYWTRRNIDLGYILADWQYRAFLEATYFYRPLTWSAGHWHFGVYARYPHRNYFYFGHHAFWDTYHGAHAWHCHPKKSWYSGKKWVHHSAGHSNRHDNGHSIGMRDKFNNGHYGRGEKIDTKPNHKGDRPGSNRGDVNTHKKHNDKFTARPEGNKRFEGNRQSSTWSTVGSSAPVSSQRFTGSSGANHSHNNGMTQSRPSRGNGSAVSGTSRGNSSKSNSGMSHSSSSRSGNNGNNGGNSHGGRR